MQPGVLARAVFVVAVVLAAACSSNSARSEVSPQPADAGVPKPSGTVDAGTSTGGSSAAGTAGKPSVSGSGGAAVSPADGGIEISEWRQASLTNYTSYPE